jgi:hypothetical protein
MGSVSGLHILVKSEYELFFGVQKLEEAECGLEESVCGMECERILGPRDATRVSSETIS